MENPTEITKNGLLVLKAEARINCRCGNECANRSNGLSCTRARREEAIMMLDDLGISLESDNSHYSVYVVELSKDVLRENKFRARNHKYLTGKPCVYVGMTGLDPDVRFKKHKDGIKSNVYVERYGIRLMPSLYERYNPMSFEDAKAKEISLANELINNGYGVWQA